MAQVDAVGKVPSPVDSDRSVHTSLVLLCLPKLSVSVGGLGGRATLLDVCVKMHFSSH